MKNKKFVYFFCKRIFDVIFSLIGLVFLIPSCIIIKILYLITGDFNNIFFVQDRIGLNGKNFKFYKFRTMFVDADDILEEILKTDSELAIEYRKNKKIKNDPRITKIGRFIRNSSLDELPQILNILKNDMSLIGNRPYLPREKEDMGEYYFDIIKTKPGLTGYWQVNGRSDVSFESRLKLEQYYSNNCSLVMDIKIFFKTFLVVIKGAISKGKR